MREGGRNFGGIEAGALTLIEREFPRPEDT
jgi:hypothetical protein